MPLDTGIQEEKKVAGRDNVQTVSGNGIKISSYSSNNNNSGTIIVMSDSRPLKQHDYHQLAYAINADYAKTFGYHIQFYHTPCQQQKTGKKCVACTHPTYGGRSSPWCKLQAINHTMHLYSAEGKPQFDRIVYLDSDVFVNRRTEPFKDEYFANTLNMFWNMPHTFPLVCTGIQFWLNTPKAREMLAAWWNIDSRTSGFGTRHDYEQSAFHPQKHTIKNNGNSSGMLAFAPQHIHVIQEHVREASAKENRGGFFRHITAKHNNIRAARMQTYMEEHGIDNEFVQ